MNADNKYKYCDNCHSCIIPCRRNKIIKEENKKPINLVNKKES